MAHMKLLVAAAVPVLFVSILYSGEAVLSSKVAGDAAFP